MRKSKSSKPRKEKSPKPVEDKSDPYFAYTVMKKPFSGGLYFMRKVAIYDGKVVSIEDSVENLGSIQIAKVGDALEAMFQ